MSNRREILADTLARLEVERYKPRTSWNATRSTHCDPPRTLTAEEQAHNRAVLLEALSDDPVVVAFRERQGAA